MPDIAVARELLPLALQGGTEMAHWVKHALLVIALLLIAGMALGMRMHWLR